MPTATAVEPNAAVLAAVKKVSAIATLPEITTKIIATVEDPNSSAASLHKIISHDPALVARVMKVVNSAFYGLPGQIASIERAIVLLGLNAIKNIAVSASLGQLFRGVSLCEGYSAKDLWKHCVAVGVAARELARQMKFPLADEAFLAGMIHDVGILVALQTMPEKLRQVCQTVRGGDREFCEVEAEIMGMDHQQLGMALAAQWKFPRSVQLVAGYHHCPTVLAEEHALLARMVYVADSLACDGSIGFNLTAKHQKLESATLAELNIDAGIVEHTRAALPNLVQECSSIFGS